MNTAKKEFETEAKYEYRPDGTLKKCIKAMMSGFSPYQKTITYNENGTTHSIEIAHLDGTPHTKKVFAYKESNPYTVYAVVFEAYQDGHCIQKRTAMLDLDGEVQDCVKEKNEFFSVRVGKRVRDFSCEEYYTNAYLDKFGEVRSCKTKSLLFK